MTADDDRRRRIATREIAEVWLSDHIGRIAGIVLGLLALGGLCFLAAIGFPPAFGLLSVVIVGVALIAVGGRMHGLR